MPSAKRETILLRLFLQFLDLHLEPGVFVAEFLVLFQHGVENSLYLASDVLL
jgi:hypothetical protein